MGRKRSEGRIVKNELRKRLTEAFREKGVQSLYDKRRLMNEGLGYTTTFANLSEYDLEQLIEFVQSHTKAELQSDIIGWFAVTERDKGLNKMQMRKLLAEIKGDMEVTLFTYQVEGYDRNTLNLYGLISHPFYQNNRETIHEVFSGLQVANPTSYHESYYTLNEQFYVATLRKNSDKYKPKVLNGIPQLET